MPTAYLHNLLMFDDNKKQVNWIVMMLLQRIAKIHLLGIEVRL